MPTVTYSTVLDVTPDRLWRVVRDFGDLPRWFPFIERTELEDGAVSDQVGAVRRNTVAETGNVIREQLVELSDRDRRIVYAIVGGDVPMTDYVATLTLHHVVDGDRTFATWSATFEPVGELAPLVEWVRDGIFATCLAELSRVTTSAPVGSS